MAKDINFDQFSEIIKERASKLNDNLEKSIKLCVEKVRSDIQYSMANTSRNMNVTYYKNNKTKAHHPSLPGNPPAPDTGNLRESIRYEVHNDDGKVYGIVGSTQKKPDYGLYLEYGTSDGRIAPRPWLRPAMRNDNEFIHRTIAIAVKNTLTGESKW